MENFQQALQRIPGKSPHIQEVIYFPEIGSTNAEAVERARSGALSGTVVVAESQSSGRGRLGRHWDSPSGKGLYFSLILRPALPAAQAPLTTLAVGLGLAQIFRESGIHELILKWPNDLIVAKKKLGGILTEMYHSGSRVDFIVVGVGINVSQTDADFSPEVASLATSLQQITKRVWDRAELLEKLLNTLTNEVERLATTGPAILVRRWEEESGMIGLPISFEEGGQKDGGRVLGLAADGRLRVQKEDGSVAELLAEDTTLL
ncbi:MAG: biotin--[acetyl-CoA-carboxylase] ligase [Deltaproteobacteria bacterium]|nr:biotin--[acetyl-CoA-carboxylase] ligase [Deltaproteobacteria bacterium]